jgi:site-specific DNA recombinase
MTRAALYLRVSRDATGERLGVTRQKQDCEALAAARGWEVAHVLVENDTSASVGPRPEFDRLLNLMQSGSVDVVVVWHIDRLLRKMTDLERVIEIVETTGVGLATVSGDIDLSSDMGRMVGRIMASVARAEVERKSARQKRANQQRAEAGQPHRARRAYGYEQDGVTIRESEAAVLRVMADKLLKGWSYNELAYYLNEQGHTTALGNPFYSVAIRQMMQRKRYAGIREHNGVEYEATWPPIFDRETWARLQHNVRERTDKQWGVPKARRYLLTGLLECGNCGAPLNGSTTKDRKTNELRPTYRCRSQGRTKRAHGCGKVSRGALPLEHFLKELILYRLDTPDLERLLAGDNGTQLGELLSRREAMTSKLDELTDSFADGTLDKLAYKRASERVRGRLRDVDAEIEQLQRHGMSVALQAGQSVREAWDENSNGWRRQLIGMLVEKIIVMPSKKHPRYKIGDKTYYFDVDATDVVWRA